MSFTILFPGFPLELVFLQQLFQLLPSVQGNVGLFVPKNTAACAAHGFDRAIVHCVHDAWHMGSGNRSARSWATLHLQQMKHEHENGVDRSIAAFIAILMFVACLKIVYMHPSLLYFFFLQFYVYINYITLHCIVLHYITFMSIYIPNFNDANNV